MEYRNFGGENPLCTYITDLYGWGVRTGVDLFCFLEDLFSNTYLLRLPSVTDKVVGVEEGVGVGVGVPKGRVCAVPR